MELLNRCSSVSCSSSESSTSDSSMSGNKLASEMSKSERIKGPWSAEEDKILTRLVERFGARNWSLISKYIKGRSGKSCRLRWCNQLSPNVEHRPFSQAEDETILAAHAECGNRWATIARLLPGRTDNAVKNHWNSTLRRRQQQRRQVEEMKGNSGDMGVIEASGSGPLVKDEMINVVTPSTRMFPANVYEDSDPMTRLSLGPPGVGSSSGLPERRTESLPVGFWDVMRNVIAREVRDYVTSSFSETSSSGFH